MAIKKSDLIELLVEARVNLPDEKALKFTAMYPHWKADVTVEAGQRYQHEGVLYKVLQGHTTQKTWAPVAAPSLFAKVLIPDAAQIYAWEQPESTNGYSKGDKVTHKGATWESLVDDNVWEPSAVGTESCWVKVAE